MRLFLLYFLTLFLVFESMSQTSVWKVEKEGNIIYFASDFGAIARSDYPLPKEYYKASNVSDILVLVSEYEEYDDYTEVDTSILKSSTDKESYQKLIKIGNKLKVDISYLKCQTSTDALSYLYGMQYYKMGLDGKGIGISFYRSADVAKKEIQYLASKESLNSIEEKVPQEMIDKSFNKNLDEFENIKKEYKVYRKNWVKGITTKIECDIEKLRIENLEKYALYHQAKVDLFFPKIEELLTNDKIEFVLMSRFHMLGNEGVFAKLKEKGYRIEQLKY